MKRLFRSVVAFIAVGTLVVGASTPAQGQVTDGIVSITLEGCTIVVTVASSNGSDAYSLEVWDDGALLGTDVFAVPAGGTGQGRYTITAAVQQGASGLGIHVRLEGSTVDFVDPYNGADHIIERCATQSTTPETRPEVVTTTTAPATTTTRPATTTTTRPGSTTSTTSVTPTTSVQPTTTVVVTTVPGSLGSGGQAPAAPAARPLAGRASYTG